MSKSEVINKLSEKLGHHLYAGGNEIRFCCPFCLEMKQSPDRKYHFYLNVNKGWICFRCGSKGSIDRLLRLFGIEIEDQEIVTEDDIQSLIKSFEHKIVIENRPSTIEFPDEVKPILKNSMAWNYLVVKRQFPVEKIKEFSLMCGTYKDDFRIFVPIFWPKDGELVYWVARKTFNKSSKCPRYTNPVIKEKPFFFNLQRAKNYSQVIITEGVFSSMAAGSNAIALLGKTISDLQKDTLLRTNFREYVISLDGDARPEALQLANFLVENGRNVSIIMLPEEHDPDSLGSEEFEKFKENRIRYDLENRVKLSIGM